MTKIGITSRFIQACILQCTVILLVICQSILVFAENSFDTRIDKIVITGNHSIETSTVQEYLGINVGSNYSSHVKEDAIQNLYKTGFFQKIKIDFVQSILTVSLLENQFISSISIVGNHKIQSAAINKYLKLVTGEYLNDYKLRKDIMTIKSLYIKRGFLDVKVEAQIVNKNSQSGIASIVFKITEGNKVGLFNIIFIGNKHYKDIELKSLIRSRVYNPIRIWEVHDLYDLSNIEHDKMLLEEFYNSVGFADFKINSVTSILDPKKGITVIYSIDEGSKYNFGSTKLVNELSKIDDQEILKHFDIKYGTVFNIYSIKYAIQKVKDSLEEMGYNGLDIDYDMVFDHFHKLVDINITVKYMPKIFIDNIIIRGNVRTKDQVIRNKFDFHEGDILNGDSLFQAKYRLEQLNYFKYVMIKTSPTNFIDKKNLLVEVDEKSTATLGLNVAYSSQNKGFSGGVNLSESNFGGNEQLLNIAANFAGKNNNALDIDFVTPGIFNKRFSFGMGFFLHASGHVKDKLFGATDLQNFDNKAVGGSLSFYYQVNNYISQALHYNFSRLKMNTNSQSRFVTDDSGKFTESSLHYNITLDKLDSPMLPKNGYILNASERIAGLGGNIKYFRHEVSLKLLKSFFDNRWTFKNALNAGKIHAFGSDKRVYVFNRFNLGDESLKGFEFGGIGPKEKSDTPESLGGNNYYSFATELEVPLPISRSVELSGRVFMNLGSVWGVDTKADNNIDFYNDKSIRIAAGFGFTLLTPLAPIQVSWAWPIKKKKYDVPKNFHITFSTNF
ncbi:outer membrane protein assembly factor BamA [Rickettsia endosymbiont of Cardiosporidium cionae]|uniref:outer membrane protein assembly factor BamA n=1 Tax=Rickettsia endosymbiont of Cardiosporidium cionae TaxID=2777155 RepID=UPI001894030C|nr:outer membrane protein assembly factor BamA [Rickettsia endosymbiont of Cardiosporidium cionae]KAF8818815.1 outer membrane protein assembly factor BamA [Rickettsia endosymbiont of Cardiosporidium cionae]